MKKIWAFYKSNLSHAFRLLFPDFRDLTNIEALLLTIFVPLLAYFLMLIQ